MFIFLENGETTIIEIRKRELINYFDMIETWWTGKPFLHSLINDNFKN